MLGVAMVALGWDRGPDVLVDFGRELYVPWRLTHGEVLHREIAWFNGPMAPWILEGWMRVFGVSLDAVQALNAMVIACTTALLVLLMGRVTSRGAAWASGATFLTVFAVAQQESIGNFHFLSPYSHGITFGFLAGLACLEALARGLELGRTRWFFAAGVAAGAAFLTKAEIALPTGLASGFMLLALAVSERHWLLRLRSFLAYQLGAAVIIGLAYARLHAQLDGDGVFRAMLGTWPYALDERARDLAFYREMRGTDDLLESLRRMGAWTAGIGAFVTLVLAAGARLGLVAGRWGRPAAFALASVLAFGALQFVTIKWLLLPLPLVLAVCTLAILRRWTLSPRADALNAARLSLLVFSLALLPKVLLAPMARQYGFVLAVPGTMVLVSLVTHYIPQWTSEGFGRRATRWLGGSNEGIQAQRRAMSAAGLALVAVFCTANVFATVKRFQAKTVNVGSGPDRVLAKGFRGMVMAELLRDLRARMGPNDTLLVLPEGIMVNYQLRRKTPTRVVNFMPPELIFFDESVIAAELDASPPDFVALIHRPTTDYGYPFFGQGYGEPIMDWVREHYDEVRVIESDPFDPRPKVFGAAVLQRRAD